MNLFFLLIMSILHVFYIFVLLDREKKTSFFYKKVWESFAGLKKSTTFAPQSRERKQR